MDESILSFLNSVTIAECRVQNTPRYIFLCGGKTRRRATGTYLSARDFFHRYLKANHQELLKRVRLAETINDWFDNALFGDLLELEEILADFADLTILFVESPGSIAELGAFAASERLRPRTVAILNSNHDQERTFISDGPVRRINAIDEDLIRYGDWDTENPNDAESLNVFADLSKDLIGLIEERSGSLPLQSQLIQSHGPTMLLIADYIDMVGISFRSEILECLNHWKYSTDRKTIDKYLSLLERFKLVKKERLSNQTYFLSRAKTSYIKYKFVAGTKITDRDRLKSVIRSSVERSDLRRAGILRRDIAERTKQSRRSR